MRCRKAFAFCASALLLVTTACSSSGTATAPPAVVHWHSCPQLLIQNNIADSAFHNELRVRCGIVSAPLDYADPSGPSIDIHVVELHDARNIHSVGAIITNFGGPGVSGVTYAVSYAYQLQTLLRHADIIGFDPRGVGTSAPVQCLDDAQLDAIDSAEPDVATSAGAEQATAIATNYAHACQHRYGAALSHYSTVATARDMDRIRAAVGDEHWNYIGFSYGTKLGWVYARLFPKRVRAAVLDGAGDPTLTTASAQVQSQLSGFEAALDQFARYCRTQPSCNALGDTRAAVLRLRAKVIARPLPITGTRMLTVGLFDTAVLQGLYFRSGWTGLATALVAADQGDGGDLAALADAYNGRSTTGRYDNTFDAYNTITCNDSPRGPSTAQLHATARTWESRYPIFGPLDAEQLTICQQWQPKRTVVPAAVRLRQGAVLVIGGRHDPATPYSGALHLTSALGSAALLTWTGQGHTAFLQNHACVDRIADAVLLELKLPPGGATCRT